MSVLQSALSQYYSAPVSEAHRIANGLTVRARVRPDAWYANNSRVVTHFWLDGNGYRKGFSLNVQASGAVLVPLYDGSGPNVIYYRITAAALSLGTWYDLAFTWSTPTLAIYCNGEVMTTTEVGTAPTMIAYDSGTPLRVGGLYLASTGGWYHSDVAVEDVRVYNRVLHINELRTISALHGADGIVNGLVSRWLMTGQEQQVAEIDHGSAFMDLTPHGSGVGNYPSPHSPVLVGRVRRGRRLA
jgi:hypothetical protein